MNRKLKMYQDLGNSEGQSLKDKLRWLGGTVLAQHMHSSAIPENQGKKSKSEMSWL